MVILAYSLNVCAIFIYYLCFSIDVLVFVVVAVMQRKCLNGFMGVSVAVLAKIGWIQAIYEITSSKCYAVSVFFFRANRKSQKTQNGDTCYGPKNVVKIGCSSVW